VDLPPTLGPYNFLNIHLITEIFGYLKDIWVWSTFLTSGMPINRNFSKLGFTLDLSPTLGLYNFLNIYPITEIFAYLNDSWVCSTFLTSDLPHKSQL